MIEKSKYKKYAESLAVSSIQELTPAERTDAERLVRDAWDVRDKLIDVLKANVIRAHSAVEECGGDACGACVMRSVCDKLNDVREANRAYWEAFQ